MTMIDDLLTDAREHMDKSVEATRQKFGSIRTGITASGGTGTNGSRGGCPFDPPFDTRGRRPDRS